MVSKDLVVQYLQLLLQGADLESTSEDSLKSKLRSYFIQDTSQFDADVQEAIQKHIILQSQVRIAPGKRFREDDAQQDVPYASNKQVRQLEIQDSGPKKLFLLTEDGRFRCTIRDMQGTPIVEIRAYSPESGQMIPTREGVHLTNDEWTTLSLASKHLSQALQLADVSCRVSLGTSRMVTLASDGCGAVTVCIPPGGGIPGNPEAPLKGISLPGTAFQALSQDMAAVRRALDWHSSRPSAQERGGISESPAPPKEHLVGTVASASGGPAREPAAQASASGAPSKEPRDSASAPGAPARTRAAPVMALKDLPREAAPPPKTQAPTAAAPALPAKGGLQPPGAPAIATGEAARPPRRKRVRSKRLKAGAAASGTGPGAAGHVPAADGGPPSQSATPPFGGEAVMQPAAFGSSFSTAAHLPAFGGSGAMWHAAPAHPFAFTASGRPAAAASAHPAVRPAQTAAMSGAGARLPAPPPDVTAAAPRPAASSAGRAGGARAPLQTSAPMNWPGAADNAASAHGWGGRPGDTPSLMRATGHTEAGRPRGPKHRSSAISDNATSASAFVNRELSAAHSTAGCPAGGAGRDTARGDPLSARNHDTDTPAHARPAFAPGQFPGFPGAQAVFQGGALDPSFIFPAAAATALAPLDMLHVGQQYKAASGGALWLLGPRDVPEGMCVHVHRESGHVVVSLGVFRLLGNERWAPSRRGVTLTLQQFNGVVVSHKKVAKAVRTGKNVDTRFSPDWSLLVMHHPGFGTTSVSLQPAVDGAAAVAMSWRGAKGVTLSGGEWLMLDALLPRVRESINSLKDPVRPWVDASTWRRGAEEQPADAAGTAPS